MWAGSENGEENMGVKTRRFFYPSQVLTINMGESLVFRLEQHPCLLGLQATSYVIHNTIRMHEHSLELVRYLGIISVFTVKYIYISNMKTFEFRSNGQFCLFCFCLAVVYVVP